MLSASSPQMLWKMIRIVSCKMLCVLLAFACALPALPLYAQVNAPINGSSVAPAVFDQSAASDRFNAALFEQAVHQRFAGKVMGYSVVIANQDGLVTKVSGGYAQAPGDGNVPMRTNVASNLGSVSKMLSGVALLQLFEQGALFDGTVDEQLDTPIWDKLPPKWQQAYAGNNLELITYRHLLQHKSGFRISDGTATANKGDGTKMSYVLSRGIRLDNFDVRDYNNFNISILLYLIPAIAYPDIVDDFDAYYGDLAVGPYSVGITPWYGALYEYYMRHEFFPDAVAPIAPTCRPSEALPADGYAKHYASLADATGDLIEANFCRAQGTWSMTAEDLAHFGRSILHSNAYLSAPTRAELFNPAVPDDRLIWDAVQENEGFGDELGQSQWPAHGGLHKNYTAALVMLPYGYVGVAQTNSGEVSGSYALRQFLVDAFYLATRDEPASMAVHGITPRRYTRYAQEMADHGSMIDWFDFYEVGGRVFVNVIFRPATSGWRARHDLTGQEYQAEYDQYVKNGPYKLKQIDVYLDDGQVKYAVSMVKGDSSNMPAYHGLTAAEHQVKFEEWTAQGYVPVNLSVVSVAGQRFYAAFYAKRQVGGLYVKSSLDGSGLQEKVVAQGAAGRELAYINSYSHNGEIRYSTIFYGNVDRVQAVQHYMDPAAYQAAFDQWIEQGYWLAMVTGAESQGQHRYAGVWQKMPESEPEAFPAVPSLLPDPEGEAGREEILYEAVTLKTPVELVAPEPEEIRKVFKKLLPADEQAVYLPLISQGR